jgi:hypothetical protein
VTISAPAITTLRAAGERRDADAIAELLAADVVVNSPLTTRVRFEGKEEVVALYRDIFAVLEDIETSEPLTLGDTQAFTFRARVRGAEFEAMNVVRVNDDGQIIEFTIFARPLPGLATLFSALPPRVSARRRGRLMGASVALLARPLAFALRTADRFAPNFL